MLLNRRSSFIIEYFGPSQLAPSYLKVKCCLLLLNGNTVHFVAELYYFEHPPIFSLIVDLSDDHISFITPPAFLTIIDPIAQVAFPLPLVQERDEGVDVGSAGPTPDDGAGCHHRKLLQGKPQNKTNPLCEKCLQANSFSCLQPAATGISIETFLLLSKLCNISVVSVLN